MIPGATARSSASTPVGIATRVPEIPQPHRAHDTRRRPGPCHPRQRRHSQAQGSPGLARTPSALDLPFHPHLERVAERGRRRLRQADTTPSQIRRLPLRTRTPGRHPPRHRRTQQHRSSNSPYGVSCCIAAFRVGFFGGFAVGGMGLARGPGIKRLREGGGP